MKREDSFTINTDGITLTTGPVSASVVIPNASNGSRPYYVRLASTTECYVRIGVAGIVATSNSLLIQPADSVLLSVSGNTTIAYIQGTAMGKLNISPLEDQ